MAGRGGTGGAGEASKAGSLRVHPCSQGRYVAGGQVTWRGGTSVAAQGPSPGEAQAAAVQGCGGARWLAQHPLRGGQHVQARQEVSGL